MADLTERLGLTEGTNRVIDDPASPSGVGAVLDFAKDAIAGYSSLKDDMSRRAAQKRADDERAQRAQEKATQARIAFDVTGVPAAALRDVASSQAAQIQGEQQAQADALGPGNQPLGSVFQEAPADPAMEREVTGAARQAASVVTAVQQGKMPAISVSAAVTARFRAIREKYPDQMEYVLKVWKDMGLDKSTSPEIADAQDEHDYQREAGQKARDEITANEEEAIDAARQTLGPDALNMSRSQLIVQGLQTMRQANELKILGQQATIQAQTASVSAEGAREAATQHDEAIFANMQNAVYNQAGPVINTVVGLLDSLLKNPTDPEALQRWQANGTRIHQMIPQIAENALQQAIKAGYKGDPDKFKSRIISIYGPLTDAFTGDHSVVKANADTLTGIENSFKITRAQALPIMMSLQAAGMKPAEMPAIIRAVETNPKLQSDLQTEINGYIKDWGRDRASTRVLTMVKLFRGETSLRQMTGPEARNAVTDLSQGILPLASAYVKGQGVDGTKVVNAVGEIAVAASSLTPSSGSRSYLLATRGYGNEGVRQALIKTLSDPNVSGEDREMALATVQASRGASAHMLNNILISSERANAASPYFKMVWDPQNGKYELDRSGHRRALAQAKARVGGLRGAGAGLETGSANFQRLMRTEPPEEIKNLIMAANVNLANAVELGKYDPSTPKATDVQLRNWYGRNKPIPGEGTATTKPVNPQNEINKQLDVLDKMTTQVFDAAVSPVKLPKPRGARRDFGAEAASAKLDVPVRAAASKYGVPEKIAFALIGSESSFRPGIEGEVITNPKSMHYGDRAIGLGQVMAKTAAEYGVTDRKSLNPQQELDLAFRYLSDLKKNNPGESWKDAISRYFSGRNYAAAIKAGANDKLTDVISYVEGIVD